MFDIFPKLLSSLSSFLFPLFASYKALKTSDPAQLTPWLMYWSVLSCALLIESWTEFILVWIPFYSYLRLLFLLYLVLPQTQGARYLYETYLHPYLAENETAIEDFIASAHDRLKAAGMAYLKQAIEMLKTKVLGLPPSEVREEQHIASAQPQGYTQALLARFSVPAARWSTSSASSTGQEFFNLLASAVSAATSAGALSSAGTSDVPPTRSLAAREIDMTASGNLVPDNIGDAREKMSFIAQQREKLAFVLSALEKEGKEIERAEEERRMRQERGPPSMSLDGQVGGEPSRPPSGQSMWSALSKSKSEVDLEMIDADVSGTEDDEGMRRRPQPDGTGGGKSAWSFLGWGTTGGNTPIPGDSGRSSGFQQ